jgi:hypothetical protein
MRNPNYFVAISDVRAPIRVQSMPVNSRRNCRGVSVTAPSRTGGHVKAPLSRRLVMRHRPVPSQMSNFNRSERRDRKMKTSPAKGSAASAYDTSAARESMPLRKSTGLHATMIRRPGREGTPRIMRVGRCAS